jgi:flagellar protein
MYDIVNVNYYKQNNRRIEMDLKNCIECGRSFASKDGEKLCKRCLEKKVEDDFKKVRDYLYDHPGADIKEVSEVTGVEEKIILKLLRQDRIEVIDEENSILKCKRCGKPIKSGRMCDDCKKIEFAKSLQDAGNEIKNSIDAENSKKVAYYSR